MAAGVVVLGNGAVLGAGACCGGVTVVPVLVLMFLIILLSVLGLLINSEEIKHRKTITPARIQVPFSSTSVVCLTPMNWLLKPAIFPDKPPPFGFWINTISPSSAEATMISIKNSNDMSVFFEFLNSDCKISAFTGIKQT